MCPDNWSAMKLADVANGIQVRGVAFGGNRGISKVEMSFDDGNTWTDAKLDYPGTKLTGRSGVAIGGRKARAITR